MATTVGQLTIEMAANVARLRTDMDEAKRMVGGAMGEITAVVASAKTALSGLAGAFVVSEALGEFKRAVELLGQLDDAAEQAGASAESMSRFMGVAAESGKGIGNIATLAAQLQRAMIGVEADTGKASAAFKAMGLDLSSFQDGGDALIAFAKKLNEYEDSAGKTQLAIMGLGKAGAAQISTLKDIANASDLNVRGYANIASEAETLEKQWNRLKFAGQEGLIGMFSGLIPYMADTLEHFNKLKAAGFGFFEALNAAAGKNTRQAFEDQAAVVKNLRDRLDQGAEAYLKFVNPGATPTATLIAAQTKAWQQELDVQTARLNTMNGQRLAEEQRGTAAVKSGADALRAANEAAAAERKAAEEKRLAGEAARAAEEWQRKLNDAYFAANGISKDYTEKVREYETLLKTHRITQEQYTQAIKNLAAEQPIVKEHTKEQEAAQKDLNAAVAAATGVSADYTKNVKALETALGVGAITQDEYTAAIKKLGEEQPIVKEHLKALEQAEKDATKARIEAIDSIVKQVEDVQKAIDSGKEENAQIGLTKSQLDELRATREQHKAELTQQRIEQYELVGSMGAEYQALVDLRDKYIENAETIRKGARLTAVTEESKKIADAYKEASSTIEKSLTDALLRGFEGGKGFAQNLVQSMKNLFNTLILRPVIQAVVQPVAGAITGMLGLTGTANAATGGLNVLSGAGGAASLFGEGSFMSSFFGGASATSEAALALGEIGAGGAAAAGGGAFAALGTALPYLGVGLAVASALGLFSSKGGPKSGGSYDSSGAIGRLFTPNDADQSAGTIGAGILDSIKTTVGDLGGTAADLQLAFGFDKDPLGTAGSRLASLLRTKSGNVLVNDMAGVNVGRDDSTFTAGVASESARLVLAGIQASTLPDDIRAIFDRLDVSTVTGDQLANAIKDAKALAPKSDAQTALDAALNDPGTQAAVSTEVSRLIDLQTDAYNELKAQGQDRRDIGTSASQAAATLAAILRELKDEINAVRQSVVDLASAPAVTRA